MAKEIKFNIKLNVDGKEQLVTATALLSAARRMSKPRRDSHVLPVLPSPNYNASKCHEEEHESRLNEIVVCAKEETAQGYPKHPCPKLGKHPLAPFGGFHNFIRHFHTNIGLAAVAICPCLFHAFGFLFCQSYIYSPN